MHTITGALAALALLAAPAFAQSPAPAMPPILGLADRAALEDQWLKTRLDTIVPDLMRRDKVDMWILIAGEYNEDPVAETMFPATWLSARRRTVLIFHDRGAKGVERLAVARYPVGDFAAAWDPDRQPDQWARIAAIVAERKPARIAVNMSEHAPLADGLSASHRDALARALGPTYASRLVSHDRLALGWLETRIPAEVETYPTISRISHAIIAEGLSDAAIIPGTTTTEQLSWWFREKVAALGLDTWFHPSVNIQRANAGTFPIATMGIPKADVIQPGDLLHLDFGIDYLGLKTDIQRMAYVLRPGETQAPRGMIEGLAGMNKVQSAVRAELQAGRTGNQVLAAARARATAQGLAATIYSHPIGYHGHGAGTWIGAWEQQAGVKPGGDYPIHANTAWSIELNAEHPLPEWKGQKARFMFEENGFYDGRTFRWFDGSQDDMILVPATARASLAAGASVPNAEAEKAAIRAVIARMQAAWNRGDYRGYMEGFLNPGVVFVSRGKFQQGWQGTLDHYIRDYGPSPETRGTLEFSDIQVEMLGPDTAQLISRYRLTGGAKPQDGINTRLMRKHGGRWVIALNHVSSKEVE
jgi:uncharacterized protein (TIGR02246 family)